MTHKYTLPSVAGIENLIKKVYEDMPNPDQSRLSLIESKLLQTARKNKSKKNLNKIPWWIVLLLAGGFASAAWWTGVQIFEKKNRDINVIESKVDDKIEDTKINNVQKQRHFENDTSPIIYQRENF